MITKFLKDESGATAIEYGILAGLIAVIIIGTVTTLGGNLSALFGRIAATLTGIAAAPAPEG